MNTIFFFPLLVALGWGVALAQGLVGLILGSALVLPEKKKKKKKKFSGRISMASMNISVATQ